MQKFTYVQKFMQVRDEPLLFHRVVDNKSFYCTFLIYSGSESSRNFIACNSNLI